MKYFLKHYRAQISFPFIKAIWILKCVKERFNGSLKKFTILICPFSLSWQNFSKVNCFRVYWKLVTWSSHAKSLSEARTAVTVWNWSGKTLSAGVLLPVLFFSSCHFFPVCLKLSLVPTICPLVSEDGHVPDSCIKEHLATPFFRLLSIFRLDRKNFEILFTLKKIFTVSRVLNPHPPKHTPTYTHCYNYGPCLTLKSILHCFSQTLSLYYCQYHSEPGWGGCCNKSVNNYNTVLSYLYALCACALPSSCHVLTDMLHVD